MLVHSRARCASCTYPQDTCDSIMVEHPGEQGVVHVMQVLPVHPHSCDLSLRYTICAAQLACTSINNLHLRRQSSTVRQGMCCISASRHVKPELQEDCTQLDT